MILTGRPSFLFALALTAALLFGLPAQVGSAAASPPAPVERLHDALLDVMKQASKLGFEGRYERLSGLIAEIYDLPWMVQAAVGTDWQKASAEQRQRLVEAFKRLSIGTYASRFDGFSGQSFKTVEERSGPGTTRVVSTQLLRPPQTPVNLTYVVRKAAEGDWRVIDVLLDNTVSELAVRRSEYRRIIQDQGIDGLIATLERKANEVKGG
jgi:phospholipid transport system substrate-binding protein